MQPWRTIVAIVALLAVARMAQAISCPVSTCAQTDPNLPLIWVNTTSMGSAVRGLTFTTYPMTSSYPKVFTGASAKIDVFAFQELLPNTAGQCDKSIFDPTLSDTTGTILKSLNLSQVCCDVVTSWDMLEPTINRTTASVFITDPLFPDFRFFVNFSLVNESISYKVNGSAGTAYQDWYEIYSEHAAKITLDLENWPWVGENRSDANTNPSYLKFYMKATGQLEEPGNITVYDAGLTAHYYATTSRSYLEMNFLRVFTVDGVDHATSTNPGKHPNTIIGLSFFTAPFALAACQDDQILMDNPYYKHWRYDPSMSALFTDSEQTAPLTPSAKSKRQLNPVAYIVPVVVVVVVLVVAGIFILSPAARALITGRQTKGISKPKDISDLDGSHAPATAGPPSGQLQRAATTTTATEPTPAPRATFERAQPAGRDTISGTPKSADASSSSWVRSSKIPQ